MKCEAIGLSAATLPTACRSAAHLEHREAAVRAETPTREHVWSSIMTVGRYVAVSVVHVRVTVNCEA